MSHTSAQSVTKTPAETPFTLWTVFKRTGSFRGADAAVAEFEELVAALAAESITVRGAYDVSAMRSDADIMMWLVGADAEGLQRAVRSIRRLELFAATDIAWSAMGVHREAEFAKNHAPSYMGAKEPKSWVCVYPFVRSYDWYILPAEDRSRMLRDHGMLGRDYPQVLANTVSAFALGDWEWLLGLEADELTDLVDMMRTLRGTDARLHVRDEIPFYTGRRIPAAEIAEVLK
ncbi:hydrogen peroxide-dependent heme synthase [Arthrobacter sp. H35-D1]|uniref:hydrogen peroxide-dependent heme synthase n=1 Tax=Arthrobacter sp. H35-D1 TaxID=3046202 RepID=UPI0024BA28D4|nr:hydrogen peroxide-dependent heme synthase [Arthrobacter sp. H35-D1]MDJ0314295.1 chlorite dismutase family protein [Arthrobacter sp. H35-D1]